MSIIQEVLHVLSNYPGGYRLIYNILYDSKSPASKQHIKRHENTLRITLSRLKHRGLVKNDHGEWLLSRLGQEFLKSAKSNIKKFLPPEKLSPNQERRLIVAFDIPEKNRKYRDWLRFELIAFGFEQIQKSVWFGPALPKEFIEYLSKEKMLRYIRFFKAAEKDLI